MGNTLMKKPHKYRAKRTECGAGHSHPSAMEARRCGELHLLQRAGEIKNLKFATKFPFKIIDKVTGEEKLMFTYVCDFEYHEPDYTHSTNKRDYVLWNLVIEDVKGAKTRLYTLKKKIMKAHYGIEIRETKA